MSRHSRSLVKFQRRFPDERVCACYLPKALIALEAKA
jgi:hypothetical protein